MRATGHARRLFWLPAIILMMAGTLLAQRYSFRTYSDTDGLTDLNGNFIYQDHNGFLWVATSSGVFRFDGRHFRRYSVGEGLPASLALSIVEDPAGELLVDTPAGVGRLVGDRFVKLDIGGRTPDRCVQGLRQGGDRTYVATSSGLYWRSGSGESGIVPGTERQAVWAVLPHPDTAAGKSASHEVWYSLDGAVCAHRDDSGTRCYAKEDGLPAERWGGIAIDNDGALWVRSSRSLLVLQRGAAKFERRDQGLAVSARSGAISLDSKGMPLVPTEAGLARWNGRDADKPWSVTGTANGLVVPSVAWAMEDREGSIWVGMIGGGLARWLGAREWENWTSQQGLADDLISAVTRDRRGKLLIGTSAGMNALEDEAVSVVPIGSLAVSGNRLRSIAAADANSIWLGTSPEGVGRLDTRTGRMQRFDAASGLRVANVQALMVDHTGAVWVGGAGIYRGVRRRDGESGQSWEWQRIELPSTGLPGASDAAASEDIFSIAEDPAGRVWFGSTRGLSYWDGQHAVRLGTAEGIPAGTIGGLAVASDGSVWIAINDVRDLFHIVPSGGAFTAQRFAGPLSAAGGGSNYFLGFDAAGNLWRGSGTGVDVYREKHWIHISRADGLAWNTTSRNAFFADPDGSVWIGTSHGLSHRLVTTVQPDVVTRQTRAIIVGLQAGGRDVGISGRPAIDFHAGNIVISFASPVFRRDKNVRFRYRLQSLDSDWTQTAAWEAGYSGLKPGNYTFEVESGSWDGNWSPVPARLSFAVTGPVWTYRWFTPCWMGLLAILAFATWRVRDRGHQRRENDLRQAVSVRTAELEREQQREKARNRIFENLVSNQSIGVVLDGVAELLCGQIAGGIAVVLLRSPEGWRVAASPGCPSVWVNALETPAAVPREIRQGPWLCPDPAGQEEWRTFAAHAGDELPHAIASVPIGGPDGNAGAIVFLYFEAPGPESWTEILSSAARFARIVIEHTRYYNHLQFQAHHDSLTGLPNRAWFAEKLNRSLAAARELDKNLAILFIDIDHFKEINDRLSHRAGDIVLSTIAKRMKTVLRSGDTVARLGGDEFIILLEDVSGPDAAAGIASDVLAAIREPVSIDGISLDVSASLGIAVYPDDAASADELQREADAAMYCAKNLGRDRMQAFGSRHRALDTDHIAEALHQALQDGLFTVHYQTKVDSDGAFAGFEALLRLNHPKLGNVPPATFIPVAEAKGLMVPVGRWVLDEVCRQVAEWRDRGYGEIPVAINVSAVQLARPDFADTVRECLVRHGVPAGCVELELTESQVLSGADNAMEQMKALRETGIRFSIDDFGTGYSSLSYLYRLHVDAIKLDRSFVQSINTDEGARRVVQAMIGVAGALGLNVIAEGVEDEQQRQALEAAGCRFMQGYLFSRPQCAAAYDSMLSGQLPPVAPVPVEADVTRLYAAIDAETEMATVT